MVTVRIVCGFQRKTVAGGTQTRPLCPYPALAHWTGAGSTDDAANFVCN